MTTPDKPMQWRLHGVRVIPANSLDSNTAQTPGMSRAAAVNFARVGAEKIWAGTVTIHPNAKTGAHHHGPVESVIYVVKGRARMRWGDKLEFTADGRAGRFHLRAAVRAAPGNQRQRKRKARMRAIAQRARSGGGQSRYSCGRKSGSGVLGR